MSLEWIDLAKKETEDFKEILSFEEYMDRFSQNPERELRPNCVYLKDMFKYFGNNEDGSYRIFSNDYPDSAPVFGQKRVQQQIFHNLLNFEEEGSNNKFILLVGPNGSSKSSLVKKIMKGAEEYSKSEEGSLYTFSWIFPIDTYVKGSLGLATDRHSHQLKSYAHLEENEISAILPSELKDHPILLVPLKYRQELFEKHLNKDNPLYETIKKSYLFHGDVSKRNRMIYDALLKSYKGDHKEVLKHIRVERFFISKRYSTSAVTIEPQMHVDANMQQITMDKRLASLPPSLQSLNLFTMAGEAVLANRGILEFSDLLKRPLDAFKYLLMTMETQNINLRGILTQLDIFFIGSSNEVHLVAFKQHPDFNSFKGRINFIKVPYLLNYNQECLIYKEQIENLRDKVTFEPHSIETLCLFSIMTRIRPGQEKNYQDKKLGKLVASLSPIEKTMFLGDKTLPKRFNSEEVQILGNHFDLIEKEFENESLYEGKFGISPRVLKQIIYELSSKEKSVSFVEIIQFLEKFIERKNEYDFLNIPPQGDYNNPIRFIESIKTYFLDRYDDEVRESLGLVDGRSYESHIEKYILNVTALIKGEKLKNPVTGKFEDSDQFFISEFEKNIELKEKPEVFRSHMISKLGAYSLDNPGKKIVYMDVFPNIVDLLQSSFREEQKKLIDKVAQNLVFFTQEFKEEDKSSKSTNPLNKEVKELISKIITNLNEKFAYSKDGAVRLLEYLIKERY